jgi:hypothetical protein
MRTLLAALACLLVSALPASAQTATIQQPFSAVRVSWDSLGLFTDSFAIVVDGTRVSLGKPTPVGMTYSAQLPQQALQELKLGTHVLRIIAVGPLGETSGPSLTVGVTAAGVPPAPGGPPSTPSLPRIEVAVTVTITP